MYEFLRDRDNTDVELDSIFSVLSPNEDIILSDSVVADLHEINPKIYRWQKLVPRIQDKIGDSYIDVSLPTERGWHTCTKLSDRYLFIYGGFIKKKGLIPQPFADVLNPADYILFSDVHIYDCYETFWSHPRPSKSPPPRYGHVAISLNETALVVFGGRGVQGNYLGDTWMYDLQAHTWREVPSDQLYKSPTPRAFAAGVSGAPGVGYLHGGTDGYTNYGDVWVFSRGIGGKEEWHWEREIVGGMPPSPRYAHAMVKLSDSLLLVAGGCAVSPQSETGQVDNSKQMNMYSEQLSAVGATSKSNMSSTTISLARTLGVDPMGGDTDHLTELQNAYRAENVNAHDQSARLSLGTRHPSLPLETSSASTTLGGAPGDKLDRVLDLIHQSAVDAGTAHLLEKDTREKELQLVRAWEQTKVSQFLNNKLAKHPLTNVDVFVLNIANSVWVSKPCTGKVPTARMHFGACIMGSYVVLFGGTSPTSLHYGPVDDTVKSEDGTVQSCLYVLNTASFGWAAVAAPRETTRQMDEPLQIADSDIIRARNRLQAEISRGFSLGAKHGLTVEVAECEAILSVCLWRKQMLLQERDELRDPPPHRWGCSLCSFGQRAYLVGGWNSERAARKEDLLVLDFEDELERRRRREEEFHARLERERTLEDDRNYGDELLSTYELEKQIQLRREREARERDQMSSEDIRSSFPPLFMPTPVRRVKANRSAIWLAWDKVTRNTRNQMIVNPDAVKYRLYKRGDLSRLTRGDPVIVSQQGPTQMLFLGAVIEAENRDGSFVVKYDNKLLGTDRGIRRDRITRMRERIPSFRYSPLEETCSVVVDPLEWILLYEGTDTNYACTNLVPNHILDRDPDYTTCFSFAVQVQGVDYPIYESSLLSEPALFYTSKELNIPKEDQESFAVHKKEIISVISENRNRERQDVRIERRDYVYSSVGTFSHFL